MTGQWTLYFNWGGGDDDLGKVRMDEREETPFPHSPSKRTSELIWQVWTRNKYMTAVLKDSNLWEI